MMRPRVPWHDSGRCIRRTYDDSRWRIMETHRYFGGETPSRLPKLRRRRLRAITQAPSAAFRELCERARSLADRVHWRCPGPDDDPAVPYHYRVYTDSWQEHSLPLPE